MYGFHAKNPPCHSPIYELWVVNKSPKDAEDINKLTYQKTGPDQSLTSPGILEMAKDRRPDCGCGPVRSCDFWSWLVWVRFSPGLFPVLGPDFQTLIASMSGECWKCETMDGDVWEEVTRRWHLDLSMPKGKAVRATAVGQDVERNTVLAGDPKCLVYYVISKLNITYLAGDLKRKR